MNIRTIIKEKNIAFTTLCKRYKVNKMYAFGSSVTDRFDPSKSDIDVVVEINIADPADRGEALLSLWHQFEILFERKVDLLTEDSIQNPFLKQSIDRTKKLIYDGEGEKAFV